MTKKQMQEVMNEMALEIYKLQCQNFITDRVLVFCLNFIGRLGLVQKKQISDAIEKILSKCKDEIETNLSTP